MQSKSDDHLLSLWQTLVIAIGAGLGMCWIGFMIAERAYISLAAPKTWAVFFFAAFTGMTMAGAVLLFVARFLRPRRWRMGAFLLCVLGLGCWLFAPMLVIGGGKYVPLIGRLNLTDFVPLEVKLRAVPYAAAFYFNFLPLFALLLLIASLLGGHPARRWWKCACWWPEWFGMFIAIPWALVGLWVVVRAYVKAM